MTATIPPSDTLLNGPPDLAYFATRLRNARVAAGITKTEAAQRIGASVSYWHALETGRYRPLVPIWYAQHHLRKSAYQKTMVKRRRRIAEFAAAVGLTFEDLVRVK